MPTCWIYSPGSTGQKIEGAIKVIVAPRYVVCTDGHS